MMFVRASRGYPLAATVLFAGRGSLVDNTGLAARGWFVKGWGGGQTNALATVGWPLDAALLADEREYIRPHGSTTRGLLLDDPDE